VIPLLDIAFIIGITLTVCKGAELLLLERQKKWLQEKFESLTIRVDDISPVKWFDTLKSKRAQIVILALSIIVGCALIVSISVDRYSNPFGESERSVGERLNTNPIYILVAWLLSLPFIFKIGVKVNSWIFEYKNMLKFLLKYVGYTLATLGLIYLMMFLSLLTGSIVDGVWLFDVKPGSKGFSVFSVMMVFTAAPLGLMFYGNWAIYNFIIAFAFLQLLLNFILWLTKGFFWRVTEYNKGVYAAIILIITVILGVVEISLKYSH
jgi:hypothetical protein